MQPTLLLDEADQVLADPKGDLSAILNSSHRRRTAIVWRSEQDENGKWSVKAYSVWGATAFAGIGQLPATLASRSISIPLQRALPEHSVTLKHLRDGTSLELVEIRRQLAAWGNSLDALPEPKLPKGFNNRLGDNWRPLFAIAELAGGSWPERIRAAAEAAQRQPQRLPLRVRLLASIREVFGEDPRLSTTELIERLTSEDMAAEGWGEANHTKPISPAWLRERLDAEGGISLLNPPGSQDWYEGVGGARQHVRGYLLSQFADAFNRYLTPPDSSGSSGSTGAGDPNPADLADLAEPDEIAAPVEPMPASNSTGAAKPRKSAADTVPEPDDPVEPLESGDNPPSGEKVSPAETTAGAGLNGAGAPRKRRVGANRSHHPATRAEIRIGASPRSPSGSAARRAWLGAFSARRRPMTAEIVALQPYRELLAIKAALREASVWVRAFGFRAMGSRSRNFDDLPTPCSTRCAIMSRAA